MNDISMEKMKQIVYDAVNEEIKESNLEFDIFPLTFVEYYNDYIFKGKFSLVEKASASLVPLFDRKVAGINDMNGNVIIFLNRVNKAKKVEKKLFRLLWISYHELRHSIQENFDSNSYDKFLIDIERFIQQFSSGDYYMEHDKYSYEIDANLYGVTKARKYLEKNYNDLYSKEKEDIDELENYYYLDYLTYDSSDVFNRFLQIIRLKDIRYGRNGDINPILGIFLDEDNNFRSFNKIINNPKFNLLDKRIIATIFSSESFLQETNINSLSINELKVLYDSLEYMDTIYSNQAKVIEEKFKDIDDESRKKDAFLDKVRHFKLEVIKKVLSKLSFIRNEDDRLHHIDDVSQYKSNVNELIKRKSNRGFLLFSLFFVVLFIGLALAFVFIYLYR